MTDRTRPSGERGVLLNVGSKPVCSSSASKQQWTQTGKPWPQQASSSTRPAWLFASAPRSLPSPPRDSDSRRGDGARSCSDSGLRAWPPPPRWPRPLPRSFSASCVRRGELPRSCVRRARASGAQAVASAAIRAIASAEIYAHGISGYAVGINTKLI